MMNDSDDSRVVSFPDLQERNPEHRTSMVGMMAFLGSWVMVFAALFFSFLFFRIRASEWPPNGLPPLPLTIPVVLTSIILLSSVTFRMSVVAMRKRQSERFGKLLTGTLLLGTSFFALQSYYLWAMWEDGLRLSDGVYGAFFYFLTAFHALHVLVALILLAWLSRASRLLAGGRYEKSRVRLVEMFWHFVGVAWLITFGLVYLL
jgi:heme/copper-type cytochrome/quinol oxidase subunit 3